MARPAAPPPSPHSPTCAPPPPPVYSGVCSYFFPCSCSYLCVLRGLGNTSGIRDTEADCEITQDTKAARSGRNLTEVCAPAPTPAPPGNGMPARTLEHQGEVQARSRRGAALPPGDVREPVDVTLACEDDSTISVCQVPSHYLHRSACCGAGPEDPLHTV